MQLNYPCWPVCWAHLYPEVNSAWIETSEIRRGLNSAFSSSSGYQGSPTDLRSVSAKGSNPSPPPGGRVTSPLGWMCSCPAREGRCATPAAHIPCPHVLLALPAAVPIWLEALSPCRVPGSLGRHRGETCGQQEAAGDICSAGTVPRERCWSHPLLWWCLLITPCRGRAAKQGRAGGGCSRAVVAAPGKGSRGLWDFMLSSQRLALERITLLVLHLQNFQGFLLQNRCKTLPSVHRAHDCARWRSKKKCLYGKAVITQPKSRHKAVLCKGRAVVTGADL